MKKVIFILILLMPLQAFGSPVTYLEMHSELGDYIGQGLDYYFTEDDGLFSAKQSYYGNSTYENNSISLSFDSFDNSNLWFLDFSTHELGIDLVVGTYDAVRFPFEPIGSAGMNISGNGRGSNTLTGTFTVLDIEFGDNGTISSFASTFEQHSEGSCPALFGTICYNSEISPVPEPSTIMLLFLGFIGIFSSRIFMKPKRIP